MPAQQDANPLDVLSSLSSLVSGALHDIQVLAGDIGHLPAVNAIAHLIGAAFNHYSPGVRHIIRHPGDIEHWYGMASRDMGIPFTEAFMRIGLGVNPDHESGRFDGMKRKPPADWRTNPAALKVDARRGINELERMIGFILGTNLVFGALGYILKLFLAERHHPQADSFLARIGEQLGLGWASGMAISQIFEVAAMDQIRELVNVQVHGARLDMMLLRTLARQRKITPDQFWAGLDLQGYPDELKGFILELDTQQLMPADLQTLWSLGQMSRDGVQWYLERIGYSDVDVGHLLNIWIDHAETQELAQFRATLRGDYLDGKIGREAYKDMLAQLLTHPHAIPAMPGAGEPHYDAAPEQVRIVIDLALASADFVIQHGTKTTSAAQLGKLLKTKHITKDEFKHSLRQQGYSDPDIGQLQTIYELPPEAGRPALTSAKVLQYTKAGVFTPETAYGKLTALGVDNEEARFLAYNPDPKVGPWYPPFNVSTIRSAYLDQTATLEEAKAALGRLGMNDTAIQEEVTLWYYQRTHQMVITPKGLAAEADWEKHFRDHLHTIYSHGGVSDMETINLLEETGLTQNDAGFMWAAWYAELHGHMPNVPSG